MKSRREFLQMGVAALSLPIAAGKGVAATPSAKPNQTAPSGPAPVPVYKIIFDTRFADSVSFAEEAGRLGATIHGIRGDMTDLWYYDLDARWKKSPVAIAGLTGHGPIFCLEQLAWNHRMRVVFRTEHRYLPDGRVEHSLTGPESLLKDAASLRDDVMWPVRIADMIVNCPSARAKPAQTTVVTASRKAGPKDRETLFSWVIAPVSGT
jgi:hypothetical protein